MAFRGCKKITFLNIPNTVKKIGDYALSMTESNTYTYYKVIVPKSVEEIGTDAFGYFGHNWDIYIYNANIKIGFIVNWGNHEYGNIHIPFGTKESFIKNNPRTNDFFNIIDDLDRQYTISYIVDGKLYRTDNIIYGSKITLIDEPQKEGYTFSGWSEAPETMPAENITISGTFAAIPGDVDMSNIVSIGDVVAVVCHILEKPTAVFNFMAADVTGDNNVSVSDIVGIVNIILNPDTEYSVGRNGKRGAVAYSSDRLTMADARSEAGSVAIPVSLNNSTAYTAFQMDVELPEGATLASATLADRAASSHSISWQTMADNKVRVVAYSLGYATFAGNDGELLTLNVEAAEGASGTVTVDNVRMATADGIENTINGCGSTIDINGTTGIGSIDGNIFKVYMADGSLVVESGKAMQLPVYSLNGRLLKVLDIAAGKNTFEALPAGVYVVNGVKVKL